MLTCDFCDGELTLLGWMGDYPALRCRNCGMDVVDFTGTLKREEEDDGVREGSL